MVMVTVILIAVRILFDALARAILITMKSTLILKVAVKALRMGIAVQATIAAANIMATRTNMATCTNMLVIAMA